MGFQVMAGVAPHLAFAEVSSAAVAAISSKGLESDGVNGVVKDDLSPTSKGTWVTKKIWEILDLLTEAINVLKPRDLTYKGTAVTTTLSSWTVRENAGVSRANVG